jgi:hypothetical protein
LRTRKHRPRPSPAARRHRPTGPHRRRDPQGPCHHRCHHAVPLAVPPTSRHQSTGRADHQEAFRQFQ